MPAEREASSPEWENHRPNNSGERDGVQSLPTNTAGENDEQELDQLLVLDIRLTEEDIGA